MKRREAGSEAVLPRSGAAMKPVSGFECTCSTDHRTLTRIPAVSFFSSSSLCVLTLWLSTQLLNAAPPLRSGTSGFDGSILFLIGRYGLQSRPFPFSRTPHIDANHSRFYC